MLKRNLFGKFEQGFSFLALIYITCCGRGKVPYRHLFNTENKNNFP